MISAHDFYLPNFILELSILFNYTKYPKKTNVILCIILFYNYKISIPNRSASLFGK